MFVNKQDAHEHLHEKPVYINVVADNPKYKGEAGKWAFVSLECECGNQQPVEYGERKELKKLFKKLEGEYNGTKRIS